MLSNLHQPITQPAFILYFSIFLNGKNIPFCLSQYYDFLLEQFHTNLANLENFINCDHIPVLAGVDPPLHFYTCYTYTLVFIDFYSRLLFKLNFAYFSLI